MFRTVLYSAIVVFAILISSGVTFAQQAPTISIQLQVHGQIRYSQSGRPAEFVLVRLESWDGASAGETTSDRSGRFTFMGLWKALFNVSVRVQGFKEIRQEVDLRTQVSDYVQLQLVPEVNSAPISQPKHAAVIDASIPPAARGEFEKGSDALLSEKNVAKGIHHLEKAVRLYPQYVDALLLIGTTYMDRQDWLKAEAAFRQALALDTKRSTAYFALGELYLRQKKYPDAETNMLLGIHLDLKSVQGHFLLGLLYYELGDLVKAGPQVGTALQLNPKFARGHLLAANILLDAHQTDNAMVEFEEYLRLDPKGEFADQARHTVAKLKDKSR
ncbi:MAG TPA: tetratricopeptide repeat protein [Pyrinomonadaceae bacterium]